ncbi:MAG: hypothetical protein A2044_03120 [Candidatus Firestonebacteria bacterium GWA2_43_8]|nr:MAG: hypothetical protein A2044_03120 [Candidatus Firestonebacteria bacterium GWA2_43_8]
MAKKKSSKSSSKYALLVLFIVAFVTIIYLLGQLDIKDKELRKYRNNGTEEQLPEKEKQFKKEKLPVLSEKQELSARKEIKENLESLVGRRPKIADKWFLSDIKFKEGNTVTIFYEDGHEAGDISLKVAEPSDYKTWRKLEK